MTADYFSIVLGYYLYQCIQPIPTRSSRHNSAADGSCSVFQGTCTASGGSAQRPATAEKDLFCPEILAYCHWTLLLCLSFVNICVASIGHLGKFYSECVSQRNRNPYLKVHSRQRVRNGSLVSNRTAVVRSPIDVYRPQTYSISPQVTRGSMKAEKSISKKYV